MPEYKIQKCPLCANNAKYCFADHHEYKFFRCDVCSDFQISGSVEKYMVKSSSSWKKNASMQAKESDSGKILIIKMVDLLKLSPGEAPYPVICFRQRSEIPQCT